MLKCCICGKEQKDVENYPSVLNKDKINAYCFNCIVSGFEPYKDLVNFGWEYSMFNKTFQQKIIIPTLTLNNKTVQQFNEDVRKERNEINATMSSQ